MRKLFPVTILVFLSITAGACTSRTAETEPGNLEKYSEPAGLAELIGGSEPAYVLADVRTPEEYAAGFIPTAVNIPVSEIELRPPEVPMDRLVVVYCRSGNRSAVAAGILRNLGYLKVVDFGGVYRWEGDLYTGGE